MANYHIKPIAWKTGTQTPGSPNLENGDGVLYFTLLYFSFCMIFILGDNWLNMTILNVENLKCKHHNPFIVNLSVLFLSFLAKLCKTFAKLKK